MSGQILPEDYRSGSRLALPCRLVFARRLRAKPPAFALSLPVRRSLSLSARRSANSPLRGCLAVWLRRPLVGSPPRRLPACVRPFACRLAALLFRLSGSLRCAGFGRCGARSPRAQARPHPAPARISGVARLLVPRPAPRPASLPDRERTNNRNSPIFQNIVGNSITICKQSLLKRQALTPLVARAPSARSRSFVAALPRASVGLALAPALLSSGFSGRGRVRRVCGASRF